MDNLRAQDIQFLDTSESAVYAHPLLVSTAIFGVLYFLVITFGFPRGNIWLYAMLVAGEVFHVWQILTYLHAVWDTEQTPAITDEVHDPVDVFITVAGEPADVIEETVRAAQAMTYPSKKVWILNDGFVAGKSNWEEAEAIAKKYGVGCITRQKKGGAKAGNINHALQKTDAPFVVVFDADHIPHADFLSETMGYFADPRMAFVQTPQYYRNHNLNYVTAGAWEQQEIFFGAICRGKNRSNAAFMCGTNMVIRRAALDEVGGMREDTITEDFLTSLLMHQRGWRSLYVPRVLAEGLAPEDFLSYYKQQFRWARGSLGALLHYNPLFMRGLTWNQRIEYLGSATFYLTGLVVIADALLPLLYFYFGIVPFLAPTMALAAIFLPYVFLAISTLRMTSNNSYTFRAVAFSLGAFMIHLQAIIASALGLRSAFVVTPKKGVSQSFLRLVIPQITYIVLVLIGIGVAVGRDGVSASVVNNVAWALFYIAAFIPFIVAALPVPIAVDQRITEST